jgi:hypothetical protein
VSDPAPAWLTIFGAVVFLAMGWAWLQGSRVPEGTPRWLAKFLGIVFLGLGALLGLGSVLAALD